MIYLSGRPAFAGTPYSLRPTALHWSVLQEVSDTGWTQESKLAGPGHVRLWETRLQTSMKIVQRAQVRSGAEMSVGGWLRAMV